MEAPTLAARLDAAGRSGTSRDERVPGGARPGHESRRGGALGLRKLEPYCSRPTTAEDGSCNHDGRRLFTAEVDSIHSPLARR